MAGSDRGDRPTPVDPIRRRTQTLKGPAVPPRAGSAPRPIPRVDLDATQESPPPAKPTFRRMSPPPRDEGPPTTRQYGEKVAELGERIEELAERAERAEAQLARERRKSSPRLESEPPSKPPSKSDWSKLAFQLLTLVSLGGAGYAAAKPPPAPPPSKDVEVYAALRDAVTRLDSGQAKQAADLAELRSWLRGYLEATGVRVVDPPGAPPPKPVELAPSPLPSPHRLGRAPDVQVRTPLPVPRPVPEPVRLPESIQGLPKKP